MHTLVSHLPTLGTLLWTTDKICFSLQLISHVNKNLHASVRHANPCTFMLQLASIFMCTASIAQTHTPYPATYCILDGSNHNRGWRTRIQNLPLLLLASPQLEPPPVSSNITRDLFGCIHCSNPQHSQGQHPWQPSTRHPYPATYWRCHWLKP